VQEHHSAGTRAHAHPYRKHSIYILDETPYLSRVNRNVAAKIMRCAELYDRASKAKGSRRGALGYTGLAVLRVLAYRYSRPGRITSPSYETLCAATGLCRAAVAEALRRLAAAKLVAVVRRITKQLIVRERGGWLEQFMGTVQMANLYTLSLPRFLPVGPPSASKPSMPCREKSKPESSAVWFSGKGGDVQGVLALAREALGLRRGL
jgi:hypothetical protein